MQEVNKEFTPKLIEELKALLVERMVDNMSTKDLVTYVTDDLNKYYEGVFDQDFLDDALNYWDDGFDDILEEVEEYV
jgi:hypothetical protein